MEGRVENDGDDKAYKKSNMATIPIVSLKEIQNEQTEGANGAKYQAKQGYDFSCSMHICNPAALVMPHHYDQIFEQSYPENISGSF